MVLSIKFISLDVVTFMKIPSNPYLFKNCSNFVLIHIIYMISFRYKSNTKRIKIRTNKRLDERMSAWLQKVFGIKNQIIGFRSPDNKYYDVETFYLLIDKFYSSQVDIVEGSEQVEISFTSDNLNSSSFIRPSQPNTSELNPKAASSDEADDVQFVQDLKSFERKLHEGRDISVLFDIHPGFKKEVVQSAAELSSPYSGVKAAVYILINSHPPKKSSFSLYVGKGCVVTIPLTAQFKTLIQGVLSRWKKGSVVEVGRVKAPAEDEAPSFTTYHLQERLNQQACVDYLSRMNRQKMLSSYEYHKLMEKVQDNFNDFYRIFCEGVIDNDYDSFRNEIRQKVENNLEMLLNNVDEMDLSRPISREEQRRQNLRKALPDIEIVKVENYFEVLDLIRDKIDQKYLGEIKQNLLDQNEELCQYFSKFLARDIGKEELSKKLTNFARERFEDLRPISRCVPREATRAKSTECFRKKEVRDQFEMELESAGERAEEAPMFGSLPIQPEGSVSPIKNMSDIQSNYKEAWNRLAKRAQAFAPEEYGLLYHYLQTRDDGISNLIQELQDNPNTPLTRLREFLHEKITQILSENFTQAEISHLQTLRSSPSISYVFENFKYQCDITAFLASLKEELSRCKPPPQRILHKKSSDSQLLDNKNGRHPGKRKYSDEKKEEQMGSPSPKASDMSLYQKGSEFSRYNLRTLANPWADQFEQMLKFCEFPEKQKEQYLREAFTDGNPSLFLWVREYLLNKKKLNQVQFSKCIQKKEYEQKGILKIVPLYSELMKELVNEGKITAKMRKWAVFSFMELHVPLLAAFELYLLQKDQAEFVDSLHIAFQHDNKDMQFYRCYLTRIQQLLREMSVHNEASLQIFKCYPKMIRAAVEVYYFSGDFEELMETMDIIEAEHVKKSAITVSTLNFSGINTNPFEYDDGSPIFDRINAYAKELIAVEYPGLKDWGMGKIDKDYSNERLSVGFNPKMQTVDGCLLNREEFEQIWRRRYEESGQDEKIKASEAQKKECIEMDYIYYRVIIRQVYNLSSFEELEVRLKQLPPATLDDFLEQKFNRPASKLNVKEDLVISYLLKQKIDVLCLQEAGSIDWKEELIPAYAVARNHDSVIIYNRSKFGQPKYDLVEKYKNELDFNHDTAFLFTSKNYLLISAHLKSKKEINAKQAVDMFAVLHKLKAEHPLLRIVLGMDSNHFVDQTLLSDGDANQQFFIAPDTPQQPTTVKKRSFLQAQYKKAGHEVSEVKDHIVGSRQIIESTIEEITGTESTNQLLPNDIHPYDHYIVRATIKFL